MYFFILDSRLDMVNKLSQICYTILSWTSTAGFDKQTSDVEARLRFIFPILPKSMRTEYADNVWRSLGAPIGWGDNDIVAASDNTNDEDSGMTKSTTKLIDWYNKTEHVISVVSEFIPGYKPEKRFPTSGVKREGVETIIWWNAYGVRSYCLGHKLPHAYHHTATITIESRTQENK